MDSFYPNQNEDKSEESSQTCDKVLVMRTFTANLHDDDDQFWKERLA